MEIEILPPEKDCCFECKDKIKWQTCKHCNDSYCVDCYEKHDCDCVSSGDEE